MRWTGAPGRAGRRGGVALGLALAVGAVVLAGCSSSPSSGSSSGALTVYSGQHVQTTQALVSAFEKKTGIDVNLRSDDEDVLADQIVTEGSRSPADVFFTENTPPLQVLASKGLLASVAPSTLAKTPARFNSPDGKWVGVTARVSVMGYNTNLLTPSQLPTSVMDLAEPQWKGKIGIAGSETDFQPIVTSIAARTRRGGGAPVARGSEGERGEPQLSRQRDTHRAGQQRASGAGCHQPVLLVP